MSVLALVKVSSHSAKVASIVRVSKILVLGCCGVVLGQGTRLALGTTFSRLPTTQPSSFFILGIFAQNKSNPFFTLPYQRELGRGLRELVRTIDLAWNLLTLLSESWLLTDTSRSAMGIIVVRGRDR